MTWKVERDYLIEHLRQKGIVNEAVLSAIGAVPRHLFIDATLREYAYNDTALPIAFGQTISQPYIVASMTQALLAAGNCQKVLEVGAGSGYQAAVLAQLVNRLYSIERIKTLYAKAKHRLKRLRFKNVKLLYGDGYLGWQKYAPYDGILVTAAPTSVPQILLEQLADGGRMVIPVGQRGCQQLQVITREGNTFKNSLLEPVMFVPLVKGKDEWMDSKPTPVLHEDNF